MHPEADARARARDVDLDLVPDLLVERVATAAEGEVDERGVFGAFAGERGGAERGREREIAEQERPGDGSEVVRDAGPGELAELNWCTAR